MMKRARWVVVGMSIVGLAAGSFRSVQAQEEKEKKLGWGDAAELSFVATGGNAEANTFGLRNTLTRTWQRAALTIEASALRTSTATIARRAVGSVDDFDVRKESESEVSAESFLLRGRYDRNITERFFWYAGAGWERNLFAGIQNRFEGIGGVGNIWFEDDERSFRTAYGISVVNQEDVVTSPGVEPSFVAGRLSSDYTQKIGGGEYGGVVIVNQNLRESSDFRVDLVNAFSISLNARMALKLTHQLLFDNLPSLEELQLVGADGAPIGPTVLAPRDEIDTTFTLALVIHF